MTLRSGDCLGNYSILSHLGQGGFADVYRCVHKASKQEYAIKVLQRSSGQNERQLFLNEVELHSLMHHSSIVKIFDSDTRNDFFLVMDYVPLGTLHRLSGQQVELSIITPYIKQVADALDYIHRKQVIHCDVKPENLLLNTNNTVLLCDFGIAVKTGLSNPYGTPEYVSPEQLQKKPCPASDQYSLAATVYEWLSGECLFDNPADILKRSPSSLRRKLPSLSQEVEDVVFKALMKQPQDRYPTVSAFAYALEKASQWTLQASPTPVSAFSVPSSPAAVLTKTRKIGQPIVVLPSLPNITRLIYPAGGQVRSLYVYRSHKAEVIALAWSPDGTKLVSADMNNAIHIWNALDGSNVSIHKGVSHMVLNILWSPDGSCIAVADDFTVGSVLGC